MVGRVDATRGKRVKGSGGARRARAQDKKAHATTAVRAGFHHKNIRHQKVKAASWDGRESMNRPAWALCQRLRIPRCGGELFLLSLSPADGIAFHCNGTSV